MKKTLWTLAIGGLLALASCQKSPKLTDSGLVPLPQEITDGSGTYDLSTTSGIKLIGSSEKLTQLGEFLAGKLRPSTGFDLPVSFDGGDITLELTGADSSEAYELQVSSEGIKISSSGEAGLFYGIQTLLQLFPVEINQTSVQKVDWSVPQGMIKDAPDYGYRGSMLDVARHFIELAPKVALLVTRLSTAHA